MNIFLGWEKVVLAFVFLGLSVSFSLASTVQQKVHFLATKAEQYSRQETNKELAISYINKAINLQPGNSQLYYRRALIFARMGLYSSAIKELSRFVKKRGYPHAVRFRGDCFMGLNDMPRAAKDYLAFLRKAPKDSKVWSYLAEAYTLMGDKKSALEAVNRGLATGGHWSKRLEELRIKIITNQMIQPHKPLSN